MMLSPAHLGHSDLPGPDLTGLKGKALRRMRTDLLMIFQDPVSSLNPRRKVREIVAEGLTISGRRGDDGQIDEVLSAVGLDPEAVGDRRPHGFPGGQCQRIAIARALLWMRHSRLRRARLRPQRLRPSPDPEPARGHAEAVPAHAVVHRPRSAVVKNVSDRIAVMYLGKLCGGAGRRALPGPGAFVHRRPVRGGTRPRPEPRSSGWRWPASCVAPRPPERVRVPTRCPRAQPRCASEEPVMRAVAPDHYVACHSRESPKC